MRLARPKELPEDWDPVSDDRRVRTEEAGIEALAYNSLVQSWPEISRLAQSTAGPQQAGLLDL